MGLILEMMNNNGLDNLLRRIHINPFASFADLSIRQKELLNTISSMIANNEIVSEDNIKRRISKDTDFKNCFWGLWHKRILITNNSKQ